MPTDSGGTFTRAAGALTGSTIYQQEFIADVDVNYQSHDAEHNDIATELTDRLSRSGKGAALANISMGNFKLTSLGNATARTDAANITTVQNYAVINVGLSGTWGIGTSTPAITAYSTGQIYRVYTGSFSCPTSGTLNVDGVGAKSIILGTTSVSPFTAYTVREGHITAGMTAYLIYDGTLDAFILLNPNTRMRTWTPTLSCGGSMTISSTTTPFVEYKITDDLCFFSIYFTGTLGGTASNTVRFTLPVTAASFGSQPGTVYCNIYNNPTYFTGFTTLESATRMQVYKSDISNYGLASGNEWKLSGFYKIA